MPQVMSTDVDRMTDTLFIDGPVTGRKASRFWVLLFLASVIATAGVVADSTATVIGAMIVAPLMVPILGTALAVVLADRRNLVRSVGYVLGGALLVIAIGFLIGSIISPPDAFVANGQVDARISPRLIDLVAALATGTVGAFALVRSDVSDTLPGVAIAISLVPPLAVVGLLVSAGRYADAAGAGLLFGTNVAAILATGVAVLLGYRVREAAKGSGYPVGPFRGRTVALIVAMVLVVAVPLGFGSYAVAQNEYVKAQATPLVQAWAADAGWQVAMVDVREGEVIVTALGPPPEADPADLRQILNDNDLADIGLQIRLVVGGTRVCPAGGSVCAAPTVEVG